jgi:hypothetical protein
VRSALSQRWSLPGALAAVATLIACGAEPPPIGEPSSAPPAELNATGPTGRRAVEPGESPSGSPGAAVPPAASGAGTTPSPPPDPFAGTSFPPADFAPLHARTAKPDDGKWQALPDGTRGGKTVMYRATVHPHRIKKHVFVDVYAFDRKHLDLTIVAGTDEPVSKSVPKEHRPGLVPATAHDRLLTVFNGGFKARHGNFGMKVGDDLFVPPKDDVCTIAWLPKRGLKIGSWQALAGERAQMSAFRQTPPCLIEQGKLHQRLESENRQRKWGMAIGRVMDIRRTALALDASGRTFFYAFGDWVWPRELAEALAAAGAHDAAQLDINWRYTRMYFFRPGDDGKPEIRESPIPKAKFSRTRYIVKPSYRDFFYVTSRPREP